MRSMQLSEKEREVAILVGYGYKDVEIAQILFISRRRVGEVIASIKRKWGKRSRVEIGITAYRLGWLKMDDDSKLAQIPMEELSEIQGGGNQYSNPRMNLCMFRPGGKILGSIHCSQLL